MKKIQKTKKGFTLIEMVLVIAIIIILAGVMFISISGYISSANSAAASVSKHNSTLESLKAAVGITGS